MLRACAVGFPTPNTLGLPFYKADGGSQGPRPDPGHRRRQAGPGRPTRLLPRVTRSAYRTRRLTCLTEFKFCMPSPAMEPSAWLGSALFGGGSFML